MFLLMWEETGVRNHQNSNQTLLHYLACKIIGIKYLHRNPTVHIHERIGENKSPLMHPLIVAKMDCDYF